MMPCARSTPFTSRRGPETVLKTNISAVVESISSLSTTGGTVTAGAVYSRLATMHGIEVHDAGPQRGSALILEAVKAGLIDAQWMDGKRMIDYSGTILTLSHPGVA